MIQTRLASILLSAFCLCLLPSCSASGGGGGSGLQGRAGFGNGFGGGPGIDPGLGLGGLSNDMNDPEAPDARKALCDSACSDFPTAPIFDGVDASVASQFSMPAAGAGPCILEPLDGSMVPYNWTRPRVHFKATGATVFQITVHSDHEANDLVAYTKNDTWLLPKEVWDNKDSKAPKGLTYNVFDEDITVTVRASSGSGAPSESKSKFRIAPVKAGGSMVFWSAAAVKGQNGLYGFSPGDEGIVSVLQPTDIKTPIIAADGSSKQAQDWPGTPTGQVACVGCHSSAPDGAAVATTDRWPWNIAVSSITAGSVGTPPSYVTPMGNLLRQMSWQGATTFSKADWQTRKRYITSFGKRTIDANQSWLFGCPDGACSYSGLDDLAWIDLAAAGDAPTSNNDNNAFFRAFIAQQNTGWGVIARTGDPRGAVTPDWSHDGTTIAYTSTDSTSDGRIGHSAGSKTPLTAVDIYTVPFANGTGGTAKAVAGASDPAHAEYYPDYSGDDQLIAFTRVSDFKSVDLGTEGMYYRPESEVWVVPAAGGTAQRLTANDPPQCSGETSPGIHNSWPKWSPLVRQANGRKYYFLIFSSTRQSPGMIQNTEHPTQTNPMSQLYMATLVDDGSGKLEQHSAVFLWNQRNLVKLDASQKATVTDFVENNVTPAWDEFQAPPVPPVVIK